MDASFPDVCGDEASHLPAIIIIIINNIYKALNTGVSKRTIF